MCLIVVSTVLLLCSLVLPLDARSTGAPREACQTLTPQHSLNQPRPNPGPTMLNLTAFLDENGTLTYTPGQVYTVWLMLRPDRDVTFRGFLIQGRLTADGTTAVGSFDGDNLPDNTRLSSCTPTDISVTHANGNQPRIEFTMLHFYWTAPPTGTGSIQFHWTTVVQFDTFWANEVSATIREEVDEPPPTEPPQPPTELPQPPTELPQPPTELPQPPTELPPSTMEITGTAETSCGNLTVPNGDVTFTDRFWVGSIATHTCNVGYRPQDSNNTIRICEMTGWNASDFTCQIITCSIVNVIVSPDNGRVSVGEVTFGSVATYSCDEGFTLNGNEMRTCTSDGTWSGDNPTCGPAIRSGVYAAKPIVNGCPSESVPEDILVDVVQLLASEYGVNPLGLARLYPAMSCDQVYEANPRSKSGLYWMILHGMTTRSYCEF